MKIVVIIQARMGSSRLPGKVLMDIEGKTMLERIIERLDKCKSVHEKIIATTSLSEDLKIIELAKKINVKYFCGSSTDVLGRYYDCAKFFNADLIIRITGDSPLIDPILLDNAVRMCKENNCDYVSNVLHLTYPLGYNSGEVVPIKILKFLHETRKESQSREHVTFHIRKNPELFNIMEIYAPTKLARPTWRLTVDHKEDLELMRRIFQNFGDKVFNYEELVEFLDSNPDLLKINQKHLFNNQKENLNPVKDGFVK